MVAAEFWEHQNVHVKLLRKTFKQGLARQEKATVAQPVQLVQSITGEILTDISGRLWGQRAARNLVITRRVRKKTKKVVVALRQRFLSLTA